MKVKYKIYPLPEGYWRVKWELTREQLDADKALAWRFIERPERAKFGFWKSLRVNREKEKAKLEEMCAKYVRALCDQMDYESRARRLREEAPLIEAGCDSDVQP